MVVVSLVLAGCSVYRMYSGPHRARSEVSIVKLGSGVQVVTINAEKTDGSRTVHIEPGEHSMVLRYRGRYTCRMGVVTRAGKTYVVRGSVPERGFTIDLIEKKSGDIIESCGE